MEEIKTNIEPKHVTILTGFLGAGKTTFLNEWLHHFHRKRILVVENEFGEVNVDSQLVQAVEDQVFPLTGGCICCGLNEDFTDLLVDLWDKRESFDEIIVESTGVADPLQLLRPFKYSKSMTNYYQVDRVICLVDAALIEVELLTTYIARKQIAGSDILLLSKTDQIGTKKVEELHRLLQDINPFAVVFDGNKLDGFPINDIASFIPRNQIANTLPEQSSDTKGKIRLYRKDHMSISTLHFTFEEPFDLDELKYRLLVFLNFQATDIYRIKGILYTQDSDKKIILQTVSDIVTFEENKEWQNDETRKSDIVIIGNNLQSKGFEKMLSNCIHHSFKNQHS